MKKNNTKTEKILASHTSKDTTNAKGTLKWFTSSPNQFLVTHQPAVDGESVEYAQLEFRILDPKSEQITQRITARIWEMKLGYGYMGTSIISNPQDYQRNPSIMQYVSEIRDLFGEKVITELQSMATEYRSGQWTHQMFKERLELTKNDFKVFVSKSIRYMILRHIHTGLGFYSKDQIKELLREINTWVRANACPLCYEAIKEREERELACRTRVDIPDHIKDTAEDQTLDLDRFNADLDDDEYEEQERLRKEDEALQIERRKPPTPEKQQEMDQWIAERQAKTAKSIADKAKAAQSLLKKKKRKIQ